MLEMEPPGKGECSKTQLDGEAGNNENMVMADSTSGKGRWKFWWGTVFKKENAYKTNTLLDSAVKSISVFSVS